MQGAFKWLRQPFLLIINNIQYFQYYQLVVYNSNSKNNPSVNPHTDPNANNENSSSAITWQR
nr:hypothetical protein [Mycoplasmopsis bovis]